MAEAEFADNTLEEENGLSPFEIMDARQAAHRASEIQRKVSNDLATAHQGKALAEFRYKRALSDRIKQLHTRGFESGKDWDETDKGLAITVCETIAKGETVIAELRRARDDAQGLVAKLEKESFRCAADRRSIDGLVDWSMKRDLRTDTPPPGFTDPPPEPKG